MVEHCTRPPEGWRCTREAGHDGPCAAEPTRCEDWRALHADDRVAKLEAENARLRYALSLAKKAIADLGSDPDDIYAALQRVNLAEMALCQALEADDGTE